MKSTRRDKSPNRIRVLEPPSRAPNTRARQALAGMLLVAITMAAYVPAMRGGFIWDDDTFLTGNPLIKAPDGLYRFWFTTQPPDYFPLVSSLLWVEWRLWGMNATGYHVVNVLLHAVNSLLIWRVLKHSNITGAWLAGLIFAVHPVNVESVAWITERKNTLPMLFYLLAILLYLAFERRGHRRWYVLSLIAFLLALLSKTSVVMLPLVLLGCAWWLRGRIRPKDVLRTIPFFCLGLVLGLATVWFQYNRAIGAEIVRTDGFASRLATAGCAVWFYLYKAIIPYRLMFVYPRWRIDPAAIVSYLPGLALLVCFAVFWRYRKGWGRPFLAGLGYYVVTLLPVLGFLNIYFMRYSLVADHWQYTSIAGVIALVVGLAAGAANRRPGVARAPTTVAAIALVGLFSYLSWERGRFYKDSSTLWRDTLGKNPDAWIAHNNLANILIGQDKLDEAIHHCNQVLRLKPDYADAYLCRGNAFYQMGDFAQATRDFAQAIRDYTRAIELKPDAALDYNNRGFAYVRMGDFARAIRDYNRAIELKPNDAELYSNRGNACLRMGDFAQAIQDCSRAIELKTDYAAAYYNRGIAYGGMGEFARAIRDYTRAIELKPDDAEAYNNRATAYCFLKEYDKAWADVKMCRQRGGTPDPDFVKSLIGATGRSE